jgi:hypothetical protein
MAQEKNLPSIWEIRAKNVFSKDVKPLLAFQEDYPKAKVCLLYGGQERVKIDGVLCMPCAKFLQHLVPNAPLPVE